MTHRVDLTGLAEHIPRVSKRLPKHRQRTAYPGLARLVPLRHVEASRPIGLAHTDRVLQGVDLARVRRLGRVEQNPHTQHDIARARLVPADAVLPGAILHIDDVVILVDHGQRDITLAGIGQGDAHGTGIQIEDRGRIQGVTVGTHDRLGTCRHQFAPVEETPHPCPLDGHGEIPVRLGTGEVVDRYRHLHARQRLAVRRGKPGHQQRAGRQQHFQFIHGSVLANHG
ncbi:hypothetical protein D3C77_276660 [compost metagenome]